MRAARLMAAVGLLVTGWAACAAAADIWGLKEGSPELKSAHSLAFGPDGILFIADTKSAAVFAVATGDATGDPAKVEINVEGVGQKIADLVGASASAVEINDLAANPLSGNVYLSVSQKQGEKATPALIRIDAKGKLSEVPLKKVAFSKVALPNPPEDKVTGEGRRRGNRRSESITDLAYVDGKVLISGLSNNPEAPSTVREVAFPFADADTGVSLEIYHGAHGRFETNAAVRTFIPFNIGGEPAVLAGFTCTPLVKFPLKSLKSAEKVRGTTIAELGNRNRPLDMIAYKQGGQDFILMANSARGVMKISTNDIGREEGITERVGGGGTAGQEYETVEELEGVVQLDKLNDASAVILVQADSGTLNLRTVPLP